MSIQYPYKLQRLTVSASTQDTHGNFSSGTPNWIEAGMCRNEDGRQRKIYKDDGTVLAASHLIQCPRGLVAVEAGEKVRVLDSGGIVRVEGEVIYSSRDRFHTRIWL